MYQQSILLSIHLLLIETCDLSSILNEKQVITATSMWPLREQQNGELVKLNHYQMEAIKIACSNNFSMIQGPPGECIMLKHAHITTYIYVA